MRSFARLVVSASVAAAGLTVTGFAASHTVLVDPAPITPNDDAKTTPCGCTFGGGTIPCPTNYAIETYQVGQQITVTWNETIDHTGDFRISFSALPPEQVTGAAMDGATLQATFPDDQAGGLVSQTFTLPTTPCDPCTLQVRQFMEGAASPYYYTCAAIRIVDGGAGAGGAAATGATVGAGGATGAGTGGASTGAGSSDDDGAENQWVPEPDDGCTVGGASRNGSAAALALAGLALIAMRRRSAR